MKRPLSLRQSQYLGCHPCVLMQPLLLILSVKLQRSEPFAGDVLTNLLVGEELHDDQQGNTYAHQHGQVRGQGVH